MRPPMRCEAAWTNGFPLAGLHSCREVQGSRPDLRLLHARTTLEVTNDRNVAAEPGGARPAEMSRADRRTFLGPWRSRVSRRATLQVLAEVLCIDPLMAEVERLLASSLAELPVLTLFGHKNDPYGWQARFGRIFPSATATAIPGGRHFPFNDDADGYSAAIQTWWANKVSPGAADPSG